MNALSSQTSFLNPSLALLLQSLDASWLNATGVVLPMPDQPVAVAALRELLLRPQALGPGEGALLSGADLVPGAVLMRAGEGQGGTWHLSVAAWHTLMARWPRNDDAGLALLARAAPQAMQAGAEVVALTLSESEWEALLPTAATRLGVVFLNESAPAEVTDAASLRAVLSAATAKTGLVIADASPFNDSNRFGHFAVAVNQGSAPGIYLGRALFETVRALWPEALEEGAELRLTDADGASIGVVGVPPGALGGRTPADWVAELVQRGIVDAGQVVYTAMPQPPASLSNFNDTVRRDAFAADFVTPEPGTLVFTADTRQAWLGAALRAAAPALTEAAAWLDTLHQALDGAPMAGGWMALGTEAAASLTDPAHWPADHALLQASLVLQGSIRRSIIGQVLSGQLARPLAAGETLDITVGAQTWRGVTVGEDLGWSITLDADHQDGWRDVSVIRWSAGQARVEQRFAVLDEQAVAGTEVRAEALARWLGVGSSDLARTLGGLFDAAAAMAPGDDGLSLVDLQALAPLLGDAALRRVMQQQGFALPVLTQGVELDSVADRIGAHGRLVLEDGQWLATRESVQAWARLTFEQLNGDAFETDPEDVVSVELVQSEWGYRIDYEGHVIAADGTHLTERAVRYWRGLPPEVRSQCAPEVVQRALELYEGGLADFDTYQVIFDDPSTPARTYSLFEELRTHGAFFASPEHARAHAEAVRKLLAFVKALPQSSWEGREGWEAWNLATSANSFDQYSRQYKDTLIAAPLEPELSASDWRPATEALLTRLGELMHPILKPILASGEPLGQGLTYDSAANTLEVDSATPQQTALSLHATDGQDHVQTRLWLQVDRFEGITRVGTDGDDHLVAAGAQANLLAGGRGNDSYALHPGGGVVFENRGEGTDTVVLDAPLNEWQFLRHTNGEVLMGRRDPARGQAIRLIGIEQLQIASTGEVIDLNTLAMPTLMDYLAQHPEVAAQAGGGNEAAAAAHYISQGQQQGLTTEIREVTVPIGGSTGGSTGGPGSGPIVMPPISQWVNPGVAQWGTPLDTGATNPLAAGASELQVLSTTGLAQLIDAMAAVAPPSAGSTTWNTQPANPLLALGVWA